MASCRSGVYEVRSESGNTYEVDIAGGTCTCLDWQKREPNGGCKHLQRTDAEIKAGNVPRPDGCVPDSDSVAADGDEGGPLESCTDRITNRIQTLDTEIEFRRAEQKVLCITLAVIEEFCDPDGTRKQGDLEAK